AGADSRTRSAPRGVPRAEELRGGLLERSAERAARRVLVAAAAELMSDAVHGNSPLATKAGLDHTIGFFAEEHGDVDTFDRARIGHEVLGCEKRIGTKTAGNGEPGDAAVRAQLNAAQDAPEHGQRIGGASP